MALTNPQLFVDTQFPSATSCTYLVIGKINSDLGAGTQVICSRNWSAANEGIVFYYDNSIDQASAVWFTGGGGTFEQAVLGSRPSTGTLCAFYLKSSSTGVTAGWLDLETAGASWVSNTTANPISGYGTDNWQSLISNANGADLTAQYWRGWEGELSEDELRTEGYSNNAVRRQGIIFDIHLDDGDTTANWPDFSGNGNDAQQQAGTAPTDATNFAQLKDVVHEWSASGFVANVTVSGTLAVTNANDTSAATGTTTIIGTLAKTNVNDTSAATGTTTIVGSLAVTNANDTSAISGSVGDPVSGTLAVTNTNDTLAAAGTTTILSTLAVTNVNDTSAATGTTTILATLAVTNADDTIVASGSVGDAVSGSLAVTNANDTLAASGSTTVVGTLSVTNINDTSSASGTTTILGTLSTTNSNDTLSASGTSGTPADGIGTKLPLTGVGG